MPPHRYGAGATHPNWKGGRRVHRGKVLIKLPEHPRANVKGYVFEHVLVAEKALGKPLPVGVVVHHANENGTDNRNGNLAILPDQGYHSALHGRLNVLKAGGNPWTHKWCGRCQQAKPHEAFYRKADGTVTGVCVDCRCAAARANDRRASA